jgi:flagellar hook assembly protein FlgD
MGASESTIGVGILDYAAGFCKVFPNPCSDMVTFELALKNAGNVTINLYNTNGNLIKTIKEKYSFPATYLLDMDVRSLQKGNYYYQVITSGKTMGGKITVIQ